MKIAMILKATILSPVLAFSLLPNVRAECPDPQWVCDYWPSIIGMNCSEVNAFCEGEDCFDGARGEQIQISASDDPEDLLWGLNGYTTRWLARHDGAMTNLSCELLLNHPHGNLIVMPDQRHCAGVLVTEMSEIYTEFFASNPDSECTGWVECKCQ